MAQSDTQAGGAGKLVFVALLIFVLGVGYLISSLFTGDDKPKDSSPSNVSGTQDHSTPSTSSGAANTPSGSGSDPQVTINIAYGTEKKYWLEWAREEFEKTPSGRRIKVNLVGRGSVEGARDVIKGPGEVPIHVWSPASSVYRGVFESEWEIQRGGSRPILRSENLALTPMIFVMWKERAEALEANLGAPSFATVQKAMAATGGWGEIAKKPEWGLFKFSHTHPNKSNSGLVSLLLMAYEFAGKNQALTVADVTGAPFQTWLKEFERGVAKPGGELSPSTGTIMKEMVLRGPSQYDGLLVYENLAIDYLKAAQGRWGELQICYPKRNLWNEHPYYILDVPWSNKDHRAAASEFLDFLMTEPIQRKALDHGFRPGNPKVPFNFEGSPFVRYASHGIRMDLAEVCDPPSGEVLRNLIGSFERIGN